MLRVAVVTLEIGLLLDRLVHELPLSLLKLPLQVGAGEPVTDTDMLALPPSSTVWFAGWSKRQARRQTVHTPLHTA